MNLPLWRFEYYFYFIFRFCPDFKNLSRSAGPSIKEKEIDDSYLIIECQIRSSQIFIELYKKYRPTDTTLWHPIF